MLYKLKHKFFSKVVLEKSVEVYVFPLQKTFLDQISFSILVWILNSLGGKHVKIKSSQVSLAQFWKLFQGLANIFKPLLDSLTVHEKTNLGLTKNVPDNLESFFVFLDHLRPSYKQSDKIDFEEVLDFAFSTFTTSGLKDAGNLTAREKNETKSGPFSNLLQDARENLLKLGKDDAAGVEVQCDVQKFIRKGETFQIKFCIRLI